MKLNQKNILFILVMLPFWLNAQKWTAPEETRTVVAPFLFDDDSKKAGEAIYTKNCKSCHGPIGMNTPAPISPVPADPASAPFQSQTDGEMFWKITHGKTPMPTFQAILSEEERWQVISYIRSFNDKYIQPNPTAQGKFKGVRLQLVMGWDSVRNKIKVYAMQIGENKSLTPFQGANVQLAVQRLFGRLNVGEVHKTDASGLVLIDFPNDIPGDREGWVVVRAAVNQEGIMAKAAEVRMKIGKPVFSSSLYVKHKMWSKKNEGPIWLNILYISIISTVWIFIVYVIYQTIKIGKLGRRKKEDITV